MVPRFANVLYPPTKASATNVNIGHAVPEASQHKARAFADGIELRIMPLGASITHGFLSSDGNGYREHLRNSIIEYGNDVDMVGNNPEGEMEDNENEGWPGFVVDEVREKAEEAAPQWRPNVYLINAGTNDCVRDIDIPGFGGRMEQLLQVLYDATPEATVLLSTLLVNGDSDANDRTTEVNEQIKQLVSDQQGEGRPIILVDFQGPNGLTLDDIQDGVHPTDDGYAKMAPFWFDGLVEADSQGFLQAPQ